PVESEHGERYFLKRLGPWRNLPVLSEYRMIIHLLEEGVRVPAFLLTDGGAISAGPTEDSFVLMRAFENEHRLAADIPRFESEVGSATAYLHQAMSRYSQPLGSYTENIEDGLTNGLRLSDDLLRRLDVVRDEILQLLSKLPLQVIHGDFTPDNVLHLSQGRGIGFIDFDHLPNGPRIWDIAKYLSRRIRFRWCQGAAATVRMDCVEAFVAGYTKVVPLDQTEIEALPGAALAYNVMEASYDQSIIDGILPRRMLPDHAEVLKDTLQTIDWQLSNLDVVSAAVRRGVRL
ncbi:MAG: phosphotransferase enzyme family protein, partial [Armatimonadota bacterium]